MPRDISPEMLAALSAPMLRPAFFVTITFIDAVVYLWTGSGTVTFDGNDYLGAGALMGISAAEEGSTVHARGITLTLSGLDAGLLPEALNEAILGLPVTVKLGLFDLTTSDLIVSPAIVWKGNLDQPKFTIGAEGVSLEVNCESKLVDLNTPIDRRITDENIQSETPDDLWAMFVDGLVQRTLFWGQPITTNNI